MACGIDSDTDAETCAGIHWSPALGGRPESKQWRAPCPVDDCGALRSLEYDAPGKHVRWRSFCSRHDKEAVRPYLVAKVGTCMPSGQRVGPIRHADIEALALSGLPPLALKVQMLVYSGMTMPEALDKLGVDRTTRYRVRGQLSRYSDKSAGR